MSTELYMQGSTIIVSKNNICIKNSVNTTDTTVMQNMLRSIDDIYDANDCLVLNRSIESMVREWRAHNCLYTLGIARERTKDVDLQYPVKWYEPICYAILSAMYSIVKYLD